MSATYKGVVLNGGLEKWSAGVPVGYDVDQTNTTVVQLLKDQQYLHRAGQPQFVVDETRSLAPNVPLVANPLVREGHSALRFRGNASLAAGNFALRTDGITAAHTAAIDAAGQGLPINAIKDSRFSFWARGTPNKLFAVNLILHQGAGAPFTPKYFSGDMSQGPNAWAAAVDTIQIPAEGIWRQYSFQFQPQVWSAGFFQNYLVWEITNVSTGAFILDLDGFEYEVLDDENQRPV